MRLRVQHPCFVFVFMFVGLCALNLCVLAPHAFAQAVAVAQVSGVVTDPSGAAIVGAQVTVTETDIRLVRTITANDLGRYVLPNLPVGPYQLQVTANGFKSYLQSGIVLQVGNNVEINVAMEVGSLSESVKVTAAAAMVETRQNSVSQVVDQARIVDLPLNGRQATQLVFLAGATNPAPNGQAVSSHTFFSAINVSEAGSEVTGMNYLLDGGDNNDSVYNVNLPFPFPDALQEFSVDASSVPARYGAHPGGVVNAVTKSGTNDWHGGLFEFLRNGDVNARNFFAPRHDSLKRNQFGGTVGGKIIRDKLFFFAGFQGMYNRSDPAQTISYVPTAAVLAGDFSAIVSGQCVSGGAGKMLLDPNSGQPFPNNQIPVSRFNQQSLNLAKYLPAAQNVCGRVTYGIPITGDENQLTGRADWLQSSKHTFFGRYFFDSWHNAASADATNILRVKSGNFEHAHNYTIGDIYTFSGTAVNAFHATANRVRIDMAPPPGTPNPRTIGVNINPLYSSGIAVSATGYFSASTGSQQYFVSNSFGFTDDVDIIRGRHQIAFGGAYMRTQMNVNIGTYGQGTFTFGGQYSTTGTVNDALAAYMLGLVSTFQETGLQQNATRDNTVGLYIQDSIRLTPHVTINAGLRWDPLLEPSDYFGRGNTFSPSAFFAGQTSQVFTNAPAGLLFAGDAGVPNTIVHNHLLNLSPRLGIVWDPTGDGRQTIRVSGNILYSTAVPMAVTGRTFASNPPYATTMTESYVGFSDPWAGFPGGNPFPLPNPVPKNYTFPAFGMYGATPFDAKVMTMQAWNISYQRQITANWLASVTYLGSKTTHVWNSEDYNASKYIPGSTATTNLRRPLYLQNPSSNFGGAYGQVLMSDQGGNANYNGLLLSLQHRFSHGVTLLTNYTWSHSISDIDVAGSWDGSYYENPYSRRADRGNSIFDVRQNVNTSLIVTSPAKGNGFAGRVLKDWQISPILTIRTGLPLNVTDGTDVSSTGCGLDRPNLILPNPLLSGSNRVNYINRAAFQVEAAGTFGNLGRNVTPGPGTVNFDFSLTRTFRFRERWQLEARAEAFNVINHANFVGSNPTVWPSQTAIPTALSSSTFGQFQYANDPRILQFALKLHF